MKTRNLLTGLVVAAAAALIGCGEPVRTSLQRDVLQYSLQAYISQNAVQKGRIRREKGIWNQIEKETPLKIPLKKG